MADSGLKKKENIKKLKVVFQICDNRQIPGKKDSCAHCGQEEHNEIVKKKVLHGNR